MLHHYIVGVASFVLLSAAWVAIQRAWKRQFADVVEDPDALAGRPGCFGCARATECAHDSDNEACESQEKVR